MPQTKPYAGAMVHSDSWCDHGLDVYKRYFKRPVLVKTALLKYYSMSEEEINGLVYDVPRFLTRELPPLKSGAYHYFLGSVPGHLYQLVGCIPPQTPLQVVWCLSALPSDAIRVRFVKSFF